MHKVNFFDLLGLPPLYDVQMDQLESRYQGSLKKTHPDQWGGGLARQSAHTLSAEINKAYMVLKDPLSRGQHLLELNSLWPYTPSQDLMESFFILQEQSPTQDVWAKRHKEALESMEIAFKEKNLEKACQFLWWAMMTGKSMERAQES